MKPTDDPDFVDIRDLNADEIRTLHATNSKYVGKNVYDPSKYDKLIEDYNPPEKKIIKKDLWGDFKPTFYQREWFDHFTQREGKHLMRHLEAIGIVHRRAGKSVGIFKTILLPWALEEKHDYIHAFPSLTQARAAIWNGQGRVTRDPDKPAISYLDLIPRELWKRKNNHSMTLELINGSKYQLCGIRGADGTANHLRGYNPHGVIADEYGEWHSNVIAEIFKPILLQNGGFQFKVGTPKGENQMYEDYIFLSEKKREDKRKNAWLYTVEQTYYPDGKPVIPLELIKEELERGVDPEIIQQEYYCSFKTSASGAWYKYQMAKVEAENRIVPTVYNSAYPVYAAWDLGGNDEHAAIIFQAYQGMCRVVGFVRMGHVPVGAVMDSVLAKFPQIKEHYFPHDGNMKVDAVDLLQSRVQGLREKKGIRNIVVVERNRTKVEGIELGKELLDMSLFDNGLDVSKLVVDLKNYSKTMNKTTNEYGSSPLHNKYSHGADAWRTLATAWAMGHINFNDLRGNSFLNRMLPRQRFAKFNY